MLDKDYFIYYEELDWTIKARKKGHRIVYVPRSKVWHKVSRVSGLGTPFYTYFSTRNRIRFVRKNASKLDFLFLFLPYFVSVRFLGPLLAFAIGRKWRSIAALMAGTRDGMLDRLEKAERWT